MAIAYCGTCDEAFKCEDHVNEVNNAIKELTNSKNQIKELIEKDFKNISDLIPENYGVKDELGQNVEEYFQEITDGVSENIEKKLEEVLNGADEAIKNAEERDESAVDSQLADHQLEKHPLVDNSNTNGN